MLSTSTYIRRVLAQSWEPNRLLHHLAIYRALSGCNVVLDVGCGATSCVAQMGIPRLIGIEKHLPAALAARASGSYLHVYHDDLNRISRFPADEFDACVCLDVIEHLPKASGYSLLRALERVSQDRVIITTPNGFLPQRSLTSDDYQEHFSGWHPDDFRLFGYSVTGLLGPRALRGEYHHLRYRPRLLFGMLSLLGQILYTKHQPQHAASLLAVKTEYMRRRIA